LVFFKQNKVLGTLGNFVCFQSLVLNASYITLIIEIHIITVLFDSKKTEWVILMPKP